MPRIHPAQPRTAGPNGFASGTSSARQYKRCTWVALRERRRGASVVSGFESLVNHQPARGERGPGTGTGQGRGREERASKGTRPRSPTRSSPFGREVSSPHPSERHLMCPAGGRIVQGLLPGGSVTRRDPRTSTARAWLVHGLEPTAIHASPRVRIVVSKRSWSASLAASLNACQACSPTR